MTRLCPARGYENEDLVRPWWGFRAEQHAPIREKRPANVPIEEVHPAHRDMLLVQHDVQLFEWARHHRTDEVAAVRAAEEMTKKLVRNEGDQKKRWKFSERKWRLLL